MRAASICACILVFGISTQASAQDSTTEIELESLRGQPPAERPFLFSIDPSLPAPGQVLLNAGIGNLTRSGEQRPVGTGQLLPTAGFEVGLASRVSLYGDAGVAFATAQSTPASSTSFDVGAHILLTDPHSRNLRLAIQAGYGRDFLANSTLLLGASLTWDYKILRVLASVTATHTLRAGADPIDFGGSLGATAELPARFRLGVEAVATDLEEVTDPGPEGGAAAFVGPTLGWSFGEHLQAVAGPAWGVGPGSTSATVLGRAAVTFQF